MLAAAALAVGGCGDDPRHILDEMRNAYRSAARYSDDALVTVRQTQGGKTTEAALPFRVAFERPDRIRIDAYDARVAADGSSFCAAVGSVPGQVLAEPVRSPLTLDQIFADDAVRATLAEGEAGCPTQLPLLLADDTLDLILADAAGPPRLVGIDTVDDHPCHHVEVIKPDGALGLWIDRDSKLLRRMQVPTAGYADELSRQAGGPVGITVDVLFTRASFDAEIPREAFVFDVPATAARVRRLEPIDPPRPLHPRVGTKAGLPPLETLDGVKCASDPGTGMTLVLDLFFAGCGPAVRSLPKVATGVGLFKAGHARDRGSDPPSFQHLAVSLDPDDVPDASIRKQLAEFGGVGTIVRDPQAVVPQALGIEAFPATVIIAADGRIADVLIGDHPSLAEDVVETLAALQKGDDTAQRVRDRHERRLSGYRRDIERSAGGGSRPPEQVIAPRRQPGRFKLERLWRAASVALPGNVVCLDGARTAAETRIVALDGWRTVVELDATGHEVGRHDLELPADSAIGFLRTATDGNGRRWWLAGRRGGREAYVFDAAWSLRATHRATATAMDVGDADLIDADGDGTPEVVLGLLGSGGIEVAALAGGSFRRLADSRSIVDVAGGACRDGDTAREILAVTVDGALLRATAAGIEEISATPSEPPLVALASGPVAVDASWAVAAIASAEPGTQAAVGLEPRTLRREWTLQLSGGEHRDGPIDPVAWADLLGTPRRQWLIAAPDGSVAVAWADGRLVDRYCHGRPLVGVGGYHHEGRGHVVLATREGLEAFAVTDVALD